MHLLGRSSPRQLASCCLRREAAETSRVRVIHTSGAVYSALKPGPVETKLRKQLAEFKLPAELDLSVIKPGPDGKRQYSAKIKRIAAEITSLTLLETVDLTAVLKDTLKMTDNDLMVPGSVGAFKLGGGAAGSAAAAPAASEAAPVAAAPPPKEEKAQVDVRLKSFEAASKIKIIKAVRGVTSLGLKEVRAEVSPSGHLGLRITVLNVPMQAKDLVESAPCTIATGIKREEAVKMVEKLKAEVPAEYELV